MTDSIRYILTLSCRDVRGIVAAVTGFLAQEDGFIIESTQFGDPSTNRFFMRVHFAAGPSTPGQSDLVKRFEAAVGTPFAMDWQLHDAGSKARVLILVSKYMHCLNDLMHRYRTGSLAIDIPAVISNHEEARSMVEWNNIPFHYFPMQGNKAEQEAKILEVIERERIDTVVLARYMQILSPELSAKLKGRAINIHHSFLPSFKGARPYHQAYERGVKLIGATAHYVTDDLDEGPIIEQEVTRVDHAYDPEMLTAVGRDSEALTLARALKYHIEHRVLLNGNKTVVFR
ncbi:MAG: formyltetrahydrofolate deformylase [Alphaproteobacteria bacterium]|nr:formyltetrahydrofolate deformylase [Alphaproteobacteria bacterium]